MKIAKYKRKVQKSKMIKSTVEAKSHALRKERETSKKNFGGANVVN